MDASEGIGLLQVPSSVNRGEGDIHIYGNPHYWLDPLNGKVIGRNIANGLERLDPGNKTFYETNLICFFRQHRCKDEGMAGENGAIQRIKNHCLS